MPVVLLCSFSSLLQNIFFYSLQKSQPGHVSDARTASKYLSVSAECGDQMLLGVKSPFLKTSLACDMRHTHTHTRRRRKTPNESGFLSIKERLRGRGERSRGSRPAGCSPATPPLCCVQPRDAFECRQLAEAPSAAEETKIKRDRRKTGRGGI